MKWTAMLAALGFAGVVNAEPVTISSAGNQTVLRGGNGTQRLSQAGGTWKASGARPGGATISVSESDAAAIAAAVAPGKNLRGSPRPGGGWIFHPTTTGAGGRMDIVPSANCWRVFFDGATYLASPRAGGGWKVAKSGG